MESVQTKHLPANLKALREKNNLSLGQMAIRLNEDKNTYYAWERGRNEPDIATLNKIAELYHITLNQLCLQNVNDICKL